MFNVTKNELWRKNMYTKYQNKRNSHKYIEVKKYACGHYVWKQYINVYNTDVRNYTGCSLKNIYNGVWKRVTKRTLLDVLKDYKEVTL